MTHIPHIVYRDHGICVARTEPAVPFFAPKLGVGLLDKQPEPDYLKEPSSILLLHPLALTYYLTFAAAPPPAPEAGSVEAGGVCTQDVDCQEGNTCQNGVCAGAQCFKPCLVFDMPIRSTTSCV